MLISTVDLEEKYISAKHVEYMNHQFLRLLVMDAENWQLLCVLRPQ